LINEAVEAPLQFPKNRNMIFKLREALFAGEKGAFEIRELGTASRVRRAILNLREERHHCPSHPGNAGSKSFQLGFRFQDRRTHSPLDVREPSYLGLSIALRRAEAEPAEAKHTPSQTAAERYAPVSCA
jgi:hypothetical protein